MKWFGTTVLDLESAFAQSFGYSEVVWFPYARVAQCAFLESSPRSETLTALSPFNGTAAGAAIRAAGKFPLYIDTEVGGYREDRELFEKAMALDTVSAGIAVASSALSAANPS